MLLWPSFNLQNISEVLVLKFSLVSHSSLVTPLLVGRSVCLVSVFVDEEHVDCSHGISNIEMVWQKSNLPRSPRWQQNLMAYPTSSPIVAPVKSGASDFLTTKGPAKLPQQ